MSINYDIPDTWANSEIHNSPTSVDVFDYQQKINQICGLTPGGKSAVSLSWCPAIENYSKYFCEWNLAGFGTKTHLRGTYKYLTLYDPQGNPIDVPPPRWALKQWQSGAQYNATDDMTRWQKTVRGSQSAVREVRPAHPKEGRYIPMLIIAKHGGQCCKEAKENKSICYGEYRAPDDAYLEILRQAVKVRETEGGQNPNEPISQKTLMQAAAEAAKIEEQKRLETSKVINEVLDEHYDEIIGIDPTTAYSLPNKFKKNKESGLLLPVH